MRPRIRSDHHAWRATCRVSGCHETMTTEHGYTGWLDALEWTTGHMIIRHPRKATK